MKNKKHVSLVSEIQGVCDTACYMRLQHIGEVSTISDPKGTGRFWDFWPNVLFSTKDNF